MINERVLKTQHLGGKALWHSIDLLKTALVPNKAKTGMHNDKRADYIILNGSLNSEQF